MDSSEKWKKWLFLKNEQKKQKTNDWKLFRWSWSFIFHLHLYYVRFLTEQSFGQKKNTIVFLKCVRKNRS